MIGQFKLSLGLLHKNASRKKRRVLSQHWVSTQTAKFKVVCNVRLFTSYSIDSNLQDKIAGQGGVRKWMFCKCDGGIFRKLATISDNKDSKQTKAVIEQMPLGLCQKKKKKKGK